jgi:hypothetical protein
MSNTLSPKIVNCAPPLKFSDRLELRIVGGICCPQCAAPIRALDCRRYDDGGLFILCRTGHDILRLERV